MQQYRSCRSCFNVTPPPPVTVADYADADPAVVKSGRMKKAAANAVEKEGDCASRTFPLQTHLLTTCLPPPVKLLCGLEASQGAVEEVVSSAASVKADVLDSSDDLEHEEDCETDSRLGRKKKNKRRKGILPPPPFQEVNHLLILLEITNAASTESESSDGREYPVDVWLVLSSYIRPEDVCRFALICRNAWIATCTAVFWTRLYRRSAEFTVTSG